MSRNLETATEFIHSWRFQDPKRVQAEILSFANETHREDDNYYFRVLDSDLIDPVSGRSIFEFIDQSSQLGKTEYNLARELSVWANEADSGIAYWISPEYPGKYPCSKAIFSQISYTLDGSKVLQNTTILFNASADKCVDLSGIDVTPGKLRQTLFKGNEDNPLVYELIENIRQLSENKSGTPVNRNVIEIADMIKSGQGSSEIILEMQRLGLIGKYDVSCPPTFSGYTESNSFHINLLGEDKYGARSFDCPHCGKENTRPENQLIPNCQYCGGDVRC